jgi:hypothetical protein
MEVKIILTSDEVTNAIRTYISTQGMGLSIKEVEFANGGNVIVTCEKAKPSTNYMDR